jgi:hypothetical protein
MRRQLLAMTVVLFLAGAALATVGGCSRPEGQSAVAPAGPQVDVAFPEQPAAGRPYEGRIKDVRPVWSTLILTVGKGKEARDMRFDIGYARIVGPDGAEIKGQDLRIGQRVRVELTADGRLVQQVSVLKD